MSRARPKPARAKAPHRLHAPLAQGEHVHGVGARLEDRADTAPGLIAISGQRHLAHEVVGQLPGGRRGFLEFTARVARPYARPPARGASPPARRCAAPSAGTRRRSSGPTPGPALRRRRWRRRRTRPHADVAGRRRGAPVDVLEGPGESLGEQPDKQDHAVPDPPRQLERRGPLAEMKTGMSGREAKRRCAACSEKSRSSTSTCSPRQSRADGVDRGLERVQRAGLAAPVPAAGGHRRRYPGSSGPRISRRRWQPTSR